MEPIRLAVTVDDLFLWKQTRWAPGFSPAVVTRALIDAFRRHRIGGVYAFSCTSPCVADPTLFRLLDTWIEAGHFVANHTHYHASLNWVPAEQYIGDIEQTESFVGQWMSCSPAKYFRYAMDNWGDSQQKHDSVHCYLVRKGYQTVPITSWFYDTEFLAPHYRASISGDWSAVEIVKKRFVQTALQQLGSHVAAARQVFARDFPHIWLIHGTPLAAECLPEILDRFAEASVTFISLAEAMQDPANSAPTGVVTPRFLNQIQKWAHIDGFSLPDCPPAVLAELEKLCPMPGLSSREMMGSIFGSIAEEVTGSYMPKAY
jgi:peptidoglycan/xylan/chitin deacetylase (PgdA/CDA1 family)